MPAFQVRDRIAQGDNKYIIQELEDGRSALVHSPDLLSQQGTPFNRETMQPLFDAQYNSVFVIDIKDSENPKMEGGKTFAEFCNALRSGYNVAAYGIRYGGTSSISLLGYSESAFLLKEESLSTPLQSRIWLLTEETMAYGGVYTSARNVKATSTTVTTDNNGDVQISGLARNSVVSAYANDAQSFQAYICNVYLNPYVGFYAHITDMSNNAPIKNTQVQLTCNYINQEDEL